MGRCRLFGRIVAAAAALMGVLAVSDSRAQQSPSVPTSAALDSRASASAPDKKARPAKSADATDKNRTRGPAARHSKKVAPSDPAAAPQPKKIVPFDTADRPATERAPSKPLATSQGQTIDGTRLGEPSLRFETEAKIQHEPLRNNGADTGFSDPNLRSGVRIPFFGLSITSPIE
jgi:hypothetical protein